MVRPITKVCCFPLESFVKWYGYIEAVIYLLICLAAAVFYNDVVAEMVSEENASKNVTEEDKIAYEIFAHPAMHAVVIVYFALISVFSCLLVVAVNRRNEKFLLPWLIFDVIANICMVLLLIPDFLSIIIGIIPQIYIFYAILSLYIVLKAEETDRINSSLPLPAVAPQYTN